MTRRQQKSLVFLCLLFLLSSAGSLFGFPSTAQQAGFILSDDVDFSGLLNEIDYPSIYKHVEYFAYLGSRISGYPRCDVASEYINNFFRGIGLKDVAYDPFNVTVPFDYGASFELLDHPEIDVKIYPMEPNYACPVVANGLTGPISYVGKGYLQELDGNVVQNAIVFMDYGSMDNWISAASFGAKAVVFVEPAGGGFTSVYDSLSKSTTENRQRDQIVQHQIQPFNFPRFYMSYDDFASLHAVIREAKLQGRSVYAKITASTVWELREARNVMGFVEGDPNKENVVIISAHYDSYSTALSVGPGANDAVGIATLMEIARLLNQPQFKPKYALLFIAFAGHHQMLQGTRHFANKHMQAAPRRTELGDRIIGHIDLVLSTLNDEIGTVNHLQWDGGRYPGYGGWEPTEYGDLDAYVTRYLIDEINRETGKDFKLVSACSGISNNYGLYFPGWEPISDAGVTIANDWGGYGLVTIDDGEYLYSPMDTLDSIDRKNLETNAGMAACVVHGYTQTENILDKFDDPFLRLEFLHAYTGQVAVYDPTQDWYVGKKALVFHWMDQWCRPVGQFTEEDGTFTIFQIPLQHTWDRVGGMRIGAFVIDDSTGNIEFAPTQGMHQWAHHFLEVNPTRVGRYIAAHPNDMGFLTLFECGTAVMFNTLHPWELSTRIRLRVEPVRWDSWTSPEDFFTQARESVTVVCVPPDIPVGFLVETPFEEYPLGVLGNTSSESVEGSGFFLRAGEQINFGFFQQIQADDILRLNTKYVSQLEALGIAGTKEIATFEDEARTLLDKAEEALSRLSYSEFYRFSQDAWVVAREAYGLARSTSVNVINVLPFFAFLLIPFVFLFERLLLHLEGGRSRIIALLVLFFAFDAFLTFMHPSFRLASNPLMVVMAFLVVILISPALYMLVSYAARSLRKVRIETVGEHILEMSRASAASISFTAGIENMRKRKLRSFLTLSTIILVVVGATIFSSLTSISVVRVTVREGVPPYDGMFVHDVTWTSIGDEIADYVEAGYGDQVRTIINGWIYTRNRGDGTGQVLFRVKHGENESRFYVFMALSAVEPYWLPAVNFTGRWFIEGETQAIILPDVFLDALGVSIGDTVRTLGKDLTVVGAFDAVSLEQVREISGDQITPIDFREPEQPHVTGGDTVIIPYELGRYYRPHIASITFIAEDPVMVEAISAEIVRTLRAVNLISGVGNKIMFHALTTSVVAFGWQMQIVPLMLAAFMIFNIILGGVKERERDIFVYSSVGLSPLHVAFMFLAESAIYAAVGCTIGYVSSIALYGGLSAAGVMTLNIDYTSTFVVFTISLIMAVTILASLYPAIKASRIITPSLERAWKISTKPRGNRWEIPMPSRIRTDQEAIAVSRYLEEFMKTQVGEVGKFSLDDLKIKWEVTLLEVDTLVRLRPYEHGVRQRAVISLAKDRSANRWEGRLILQRLAGAQNVWTRLVRGFADEIRKQFLLWNTMTEEQKKRYMS